MQVSRRSWHYRHLHFWDLLPEKMNLCAYMRQLLLSFLVVPVFVLLMLFIIGPVLALGQIICWISDEISNRIFKRRAERQQAAVRQAVREPGIVRQWFRAKKDKVCPIIEVVE